MALGNNGIIETAQYASNTYANITKDEIGNMDEIENNIDDLASRLNIIDKEGNKIKSSEVSNYYGRDIIYNEQTYQLFYVDLIGKYSNGEPRVWLQYKEYESGIKLSEHYETTGISELKSILWQINPELNKNFGETIRELNSWNSNIKFVSFLCNTNNWNEKYVKESDLSLGIYAIGGVSAEMYCDSYNQVISNNSTHLFTKAYNENNTYGYRYKPSSSNASPNNEGFGFWSTSIIKSNLKNGLYRINNTYPWLCSPSSRGGGSVCHVERCRRIFR